MRRGSCAALAALLLGSLSAGAEAPSLPALPDIPDELRDEPAIILEDHTVWTVRKILRNPQATKEIRKKVLLQSRDGFEHADQVVVYFGSDSKLEDFQARTILPDGTVLRVGEDLVHDTLALKEGKREWRMLQFTFPGVRVGAILEWSYKLQEKDILPWTWWEVQAELPVLVARFQTYLPREPVAFAARSYSRRPRTDWCRESPPRAEKSMTVTEVLCQGLPAYEKAPLSPPEADLRLRMQMSYEARRGKEMEQIVWDYVNEYWSGRIADFLRGDSRIPAVVDVLLADEEEGEGPIELVARYLRENIELVDEPLLGESGRTRDADDVLEAGGGLPEEVTLLGLALLRHAGVEVVPVVAGDRSLGAFRRSVPDPSQARHLLLQVKRGTDWVYWDPACRLCPVGTVDWRYQDLGTNGIRPQETGSYGWLSIPIDPPEANEELHEQTVTLEPGGDAKIEGRVTWSGQSGLLWRHWLLDLPEEIQAQLFLSRFTGELEEQDLEHGDPEDLSTEMSAEYSFLRRDLAFAAGERLLLQAPDLFTSRLGAPAEEKRDHPVRWPYAFVVREQVTFDLPEGYGVETLPPKTVLKANPLRFAGRWRTGATPDRLYWVGEMRLEDTEIASVDYERLTWFFSRLARALQGGVVLIPIDPQAETEEP